MKNEWIFFARGVTSNWYRCENASKIFFVAWIVSVIKMICLVSSNPKACSSPNHMNMSLALVDVTFVVCNSFCSDMALDFYMCAMAVVDPFLTPLSAIIQVFDIDN